VIDQDPEAGAWWQAGDDVLITVADRPIQ
jgi:hypothetical protein